MEHEHRVLIFQEEKIRDILEEMKPMLQLHWEELANNKDVRPLNPDYDRYTQLNNLDYIRLFTVRSLGRLVGYSTWYVSYNLHYKDWMYASNDVYYLDPGYRNKGNGHIMFQETEKWLKSMGVKNVVVQDKLHQSHESFFVKLGFTPIEQNYEKII